MIVTVGSVGLTGLFFVGRLVTFALFHWVFWLLLLDTFLTLPPNPFSLINFILFLDEPPSDDLGLSAVRSAGKLRIVVSSSWRAGTSLDEMVVISSVLIVVKISVCFINPVNISNLSSSDIRGLVAGTAVVTEAPGVVNRLKAGRLLFFLVV